MSIAQTVDGRFGLITLTGNPDDPSDDRKQLTYHPAGASNNTRVMVDASTPEFGSSYGSIVEHNHRERDGAWVMAWVFREILVRQSLRLTAGDISHRTDTLQVTYSLKNTGSTARRVGIRVMLDTLIGQNDGVPFIVPGREGLVTGPLVLEGEAVPDFVRSLEYPVLSNPGVVVDIGLVPAEGEERPGEVVLSHWPGQNAGWKYNRTDPFLVDGTVGADSAVGLYYTPKPLEPGKSRSVGFTYGLGTISSTATKNARLSLTAGGPIRSGSSFWLVALVQRPRTGESVTLALPKGLTAREPATLTQNVQAAGAYTQLSWLVEVDNGLLGETEVQAKLDPGGVTERQTLSIQPPDTQLALLPRGPFRAGHPFWVSAAVRRPHAGQSVILTLSKDLSLAAGHSASKPVATATGAYSQVDWLIVPGPRFEGRSELSIRLLPEGVESRAAIEVLPGDLIR